MERKYSQLADVQLKTAFGYLGATASKYSPGEVVADTPDNRAKLPGYMIGMKIAGTMVMEVPVQNEPVPHEVRKRAAELGIVIRDTKGTML